jgi:hypothetical protein
LVQVELDLLLLLVLKVVMELIQFLQQHLVQSQLLAEAEAVVKMLLLVQVIQEDLVVDHIQEVHHPVEELVEQEHQVKEIMVELQDQDQQQHLVVVVVQELQVEMLIFLVDLLWQEVMVEQDQM